MPDHDDSIGAEQTMSNQFGPLFENKDGVFREVHQHVHYGPQSAYCPCCNTEIFPNEPKFRCPECGKKPIHQQCREESTGYCRICSQKMRSEEILRDRCGCLRLTVEGPNGRSRYFLFARRLIQFGRAREKDLGGLGKGMESCPHRPRVNDLILRVMEAQDNGKQRQHRDRSLLISRAHGALRVSHNGVGECVKILDCGYNGRGSTWGTWVDREQVKPWEWHELNGHAHLLIGNHPSSGLKGLDMEVRTVRDPGDQNGARIASVVMSRGDALAASDRYVMVVREATLGFGPEMSIPLVPYAQRVWARIHSENGQWVMRTERGGPLANVAETGGMGELFLRSGLKLQAGEFSFSFACASETDFLAD